MHEPICDCGHEMVRGTRPMTIKYKGLSATFDMPGYYCDECGKGLITGKDTAVSDKQLFRLKAEADGLLTPEQIRRVRKRLGLTQVEAGNILGGGRNAFQRYENGTILPSQAISNLLRLLDKNPSDMDALRQNNCARPSRVKLPA